MALRRRKCAGCPRSHPIIAAIIAAAAIAAAAVAAAAIATAAIATAAIAAAGRVSTHDCDVSYFHRGDLVHSTLIVVVIQVKSTSNA